MTLRPVSHETPAVVVDWDIMMSNIRLTAERARNCGVKLRPHTKTHKSIRIAREQILCGAQGITVAKLGEAEVMAEGGIDDILIAFPIVGKAKLERLGKLLQKARVIVSTDNYDVARGISELGESLKRRIPLYVDINSGLNRCGGEPGEESGETVVQIASLPGVELIGLMTHAGHVYGCLSDNECRSIAVREAESLLSTQDWLKRNRGIEVTEISVGSTPTSKFVGELPGVTEMRPGAYVFGDVSQIVTGTINVENCALRVHAMVVSTPRPGTAIIDAGSKTLSSDINGQRRGYGLLPAYPDVIVERLSEEHGILSLPEGTTFRVGDVVEIIPNHCCTLVNLHDRLLEARGGSIHSYITVDARGKII
ncbi:alanine racemase [Paenibacillus agricola]|uniref:Amino acid processing protein n=1 Tax=Paenibacillus agricola TaxID=2716264 RepID=A0ABX0J9G1_9BACL|nr:alanine racemase [Paenibacillus agricola]NHN32777.1 amino acid processing protein [Paenibacillus agricola]